MELEWHDPLWPHEYFPPVMLHSEILRRYAARSLACLRTSVAEINHDRRYLEEKPLMTLSVISETRPLLLRIDGFLSRQWCERKIRDLYRRCNFEQNKEPSGATDLETGKPLGSSFRRSDSLVVNCKELKDLLFALLPCAQPNRNEIDMYAIRYQKGGLVRPHWDILHPHWTVPGEQAARLWTAILYLNDVPAQAAGCTQFTRTRSGDVSIQPRAGTLVAFLNSVWVEGDNGVRFYVNDYMTRHEGQKVTGDGVEKWIIQAFVRDVVAPDRRPAFRLSRHK
jgi:hypothetical protein